ncbi:hypothetical protein M9458_057159, partial [Cirrhinus mrigala]
MVLPVHQRECEGSDTTQSAVTGNKDALLRKPYRRAGEASPKVLYVDRDCYSATGKGKAAALFAEWEQLAV